MFKKKTKKPLIEIKKIVIYDENNDEKSITYRISKTSDEISLFPGMLLTKEEYEELVEKLTNNF